MITFDLDAGRLGRSRFALSRLVELTNSLEVLARPDLVPQARRWVDVTRPQLDATPTAIVFALINHGPWYLPEFLVPVPQRYEPTLDEELAAVEATPPELVRHQLEMAFQLGSPPAAVLRRRCAQPGHDPRWPLPSSIATVLAKGGEAALVRRVTAELEWAWHAVMSESWAAIRRVLDEDVRQKAALASRVGFAEIVEGVHADMHWDGAQVTLHHGCDVHVDSADGLVLAPSVFLTRPAAWLGVRGQAMVAYPARGRADVWLRREPGSEEISIFGARRAALLEDLHKGRSTAELAIRHQLSPSTISYHLSQLRRSGLVTGRRTGHSVVYERTGRAAELLTALSNGG